MSTPFLNKSRLLRLLKILLLGVFGFILIYKLKKINWHFHQLELHLLPALLFVLIIPLNWYLEWKKWHLITEENKLSDSELNKQAFYSGMIASFLTPALSGNFLGRIFYYPKSLRLKLTSHIFIGNFSQSIVALCFGVFATLDIALLEGKTISIFIVMGVVLLYLFPGKLINVKLHEKTTALLSFIPSLKLRTHLLILSLLRYVVFLVQYLAVLWSLGIPPTVEVVQIILVVFLLVTFTPSLFMGKVIVRESIAVGVFELFGYDIFLIAVASTLIWVFSIFMPSAIALLYSRKVKKHAFA